MTHLNRAAMQISEMRMKIAMLCKEKLRVRNNVSLSHLHVAEALHVAAVEVGSTLFFQELTLVCLLSTKQLSCLPLVHSIPPLSRTQTGPQNHNPGTT